MVERFVETEEEMLALGRELSVGWGVGDIVLLTGELGAGKTTLVRGVMEGLGWEGAVRSPTFNIMQVYPTKVPVVHADLYRVASAVGIGLEEYFEDHLCLVEWPDRLEDLVDPAACWRVSILFEGDGRRVLANFPTEFPRASPEEIAGIPSDWTYEYEKLLELFPTLKPGFYNANDLFFYRDYFAYLSTHATQILMARYYRAAIEFADRGEWSTGLELLDAQVDSLFLYFFEKHGKSFPHYEEIHVQREKFRQLLMKEIGVEATDEQLPPEPQTS